MKNPTTVPALALTLVLAAALAACGGQERRSGEISQKDIDHVGTLLSDTVGTATTAKPPIELPADMVFTRDDIPTEGGYLQITIGDLTDAQANTFLRRVKSEYCTCGCPHTIDQCMIEDPDCTTAHQLAQNILKEVTAGS